MNKKIYFCDRYLKPNASHYQRHMAYKEPPCEFSKQERADFIREKRVPHLTKGCNSMELNDRLNHWQYHETVDTDWCEKAFLEYELHTQERFENCSTEPQIHYIYKLNFEQGFYYGSTHDLYMRMAGHKSRDEKLWGKMLDYEILCEAPNEKEARQIVFLCVKSGEENLLNTRFRA